MAHATRVPRTPEEGPDPRGVVTIEMKTTFMRPAQGRITCVGRLLHRSAALAFCEGTVFNAAGERLAHATGTFKFLAGLPVGSRRIHSPDASD
jgi:acyl-coenzyme A thioesterase PaaI-like protein